MTAAMFRDRYAAGAQLAEQLQTYRGQDALVLGIPRGGVPVAAEVAFALEAELDVIVARKLGAPFQPELALGAVTASGDRYLNERLIRAAGVTDDSLESIASTEIAEARRRERRFRGDQPPPRISGRTIIVVDDGLATGATMRAAVLSLRKCAPARLIVAVPVGAPSTCAALRSEADEVIAMYEPVLFRAVGTYYRDFSPTDDAEVERILGSFRIPIQRGSR